ncbi:MAG TPA: DivIVA domain-containing protein [Acidimicrobiales bacterium]|jgi:cell division initiation protein
MDNSQTSSSILDTLRTVEFRLGLKGYNVDEVDEYLDRAAQEAEALQEHVRQLNDRLRQASDRIVALERDRRTGEPEEAAAAVAPAASGTVADLGITDETLQRTLLLAQKFVDQTKRESEAEAADIVARAEETARAAVEAAEQTAAKLQAEAQEKLRQEVNRLENRRTELATDVESMARHLEAERNRLRDALSDILKWVDENVQPANSLMGVRPKAAVSTRPGGLSDEAADGAADESVHEDGPPTLNLQPAPNGSAPGAPRSF